MKITESQVKTIHTIDIEFKDFSDIFVEANTDEWKPTEAFAEMDLTNTTMGNLRTCFHQLKETATLKYIVSKLGFDGVENYGYYNKRKGVYTMVVYDRGDTLNLTYHMNR